eukprot:6460090-Amphidinium_carterae.1
MGRLSIHLARVTWVPAKPGLRGKLTTKARWQCTCGIHAAYNANGTVRAKCTRTLTVADDENSPGSFAANLTLRKLKTWLVQAKSYATKEQHQGSVVTTAKTESELDELLAALGGPPARPHGNTPSKKETERKLRKRPRDEP